MTRERHHVSCLSTLSITQDPALIMHPTLPRLSNSDFPAIRRGRLKSLQVNLGYRCNLSCLHCHVGAGPNRRENMDRATIETVIDFLKRGGIETLDLTGGAPELNPHFRYLVGQARAMGVRVIDRCNLTVLEEPGEEDLASFLAAQGVEIIASLPCYTQTQVDAQRGKGVFETSISALKTLTALGYGHHDGALVLNLIYNPQGPELPPEQIALERAYKTALAQDFGLVFNRLYTLTNMPIQRFGSTLISQGRFDAYLALLKSAHCDHNLQSVMCLDLISVDWQGQVYDCDFNQMLGLHLKNGNEPRTHLCELDPERLEGLSIQVADHCYGCTAGQGSSCSGALVE